MKKLRWVIIVVVVLAIAGGAYYFLRPKQSAAAATAYTTAPVRKGNLVVTVSASGSIAASRQTTLVFGTAGKVIEVLVQPGSVVKAGQKLMRIDATDAEANVAKARLSLATAENQLKKLQTGSTEADIAAAKASLRSAEENLAKVKAGPTAADIAVAQATVATAQYNYEIGFKGGTDEAIRDAELKLAQSRNSLWSAQNARDDACSRGNCDGAKASVLNAEINVQTAELNLARLKQPATASALQDLAAKVAQAQEKLDSLKASPTPADIAAAESQLAQAQAKLTTTTTGATAEDVAISKAQVEQARLNLQQAEQTLTYAVLNAPHDGTVLSVSANPGEWVTSNGQVAVLADLSRLEINSPLSELDIVRVAKGQQCIIQVDALSETRLRGHVERLAPAATIQQGVANYPTVIVLDQSDPKVRPGMSANVTITTDQRQNVLMVSNRAVRSRGLEKVVAVLKNGVIEWLPVQTGASNDTMTEITQGVEEGQAIVSNPPAITGARTGQGAGGGFPGGPGMVIMPGGR